jgi:hypothetical protein
VRRNTHRGGRRCRGPLHDRADAEGEDQRAEADGAAEEPADDQYADLDGRAHREDRPAEAAVQPGHQAVARTRAEIRGEVDPRRDADREHAGDHHRDPHGQRAGRRHQRQRQVGGGTDERDVQERADPRPHADRPPEGQHRDADQDADGAERQSGLPAEPLVERLPWPEAEPSLRHHRDRRAEQRQPDDQAGQTGEDARRHRRR